MKNKLKNVCIIVKNKVFKVVKNGKVYWEYE